MKRLFSLALLLGALFGLLAQEAAFAAGPAMIDAKPAVAMSADCMEMMRDEQPEPAQKPCHGLTLDCIAMMGCFVPIALPSAPDTPEAMAVEAAHFPKAVYALSGLSKEPEPEPPIFLI